MQLKVGPILRMPVSTRPYFTGGSESLHDHCAEICRRADLRPVLEVVGRDFGSAPAIARIIRTGDITQGTVSEETLAQISRRQFPIDPTAHRVCLEDILRFNKEIQTAEPDEDGFMEIERDRFMSSFLKANQDTLRALCGSLAGAGIRGAVSFMKGLDASGLAKMLSALDSSDLHLYAGRKHLDHLSNGGEAFGMLDTERRLAVAKATHGTVFYTEVVLPWLTGTIADR